MPGYDVFGFYMGGDGCGLFFYSLLMIMRAWIHMDVKVAWDVHFHDLGNEGTACGFGTGHGIS